MSDDQLLEQTSLPSMLQDMVLDSEDVHHFLDGLAKLAASTLSGGGAEALCGITLLRPRTKTTVASSDEKAKFLDEIQYGHDDGPCLRAAREGQIYSVTDFRTEDRFGDYPTTIVEHGILSALCVPIPLDGFAASGLNSYSTEAHGFDDESIRVASDFAREISKSLRMAIRVAHLTDKSEQLSAAMASRTTIDVAAGIIMGQNRCSHETAMTILKAASSGRNRKLADVAASVVASFGQQVPDTHFES